MTNYFRLTGYNPENNSCFIMDSNGMFEKMWQFSSYIISKGFKVIEISNDEKFIDVNINKISTDQEHIYLRACAYGEPHFSTETINGISYKSIKVADKVYIPNGESS